MADQPLRAAPRLRVLESFAQPRPTTNPYIVQLADALSELSGIELITFSWRRALLGGYDVYHVHWPEIMMEGHKRIGRVVRRVLTTLFLLRLRLARTPVVRTVHNTERPSDLGTIDTRLLDALDRMTVIRIRLNDVTTMPQDAQYATIPHGHYRDWFARYQRSSRVPGRIGYVGLIRRYKGVEQLIEAFSRLDRPDATLDIAGKPSSEDLAKTVTDAAVTDERISAHLGFLDDEAFVATVTEAVLIALPYRHMHNSGAALAALSLDRPVLVPDNEVNRRLADEVGPGWVHCYRGELSPTDLSDALESSSRAEGSPDLSHRNWSTAAAAHEAVFRRAAGSRSMR